MAGRAAEVAARAHRLASHARSIGATSHLPLDQRHLLHRYIARLEEEVQKAAPDHGVLRETVGVLKSILERAAGSALSDEIIDNAEALLALLA